MAVLAILLASSVLLTACSAIADVDNCSTEGDTFLQLGRVSERLLVQEKIPRFEVLVVGAPRTGTQSMATALRRLGYNPLHSGDNKDNSGGARLPWCRFLFGNGTFEEALLTMTGFDSAMDEPFHLAYEEVLRRFPDCKFVLTEPDPETWYKSCLAFTKSSREAHPQAHQSPSGVCQNLHYFGCQFESVQTEELKERCLSGYRDHAERVKRVVPPEKLLVFNLSDGYRPLAEFLGKSVPDEPFPYTDHYINHRHS